MKTKAALFVGGYLVFCFIVFTRALIVIATDGVAEFVFSGTVAVWGLFLSAIWIEELLNEN